MINGNWTLIFLAFSFLKCPHTGEEIVSTILGHLKENVLEKNVFSITFDNASNNDCMQIIFKGQLPMMNDNGLLCDTKFMHVRWCAYILNLIVKEGLKLVKNFLHDIRVIVIYVKASQQRIQSFKACVERVGIKSGTCLSLDVSTRWNSTYEMLVWALKFKDSFESMVSIDTHYKSLPSEKTGTDRLIYASYWCFQCLYILFRF